MTHQKLLCAIASHIFAISVPTLALATPPPTPDFSPQPDERQVPTAMHSTMKGRPSITVGRHNADLIGNDQRVIQAAVDYIAGLGGGVVNITAGQYLMRDSLHLRNNVTVRGVKGKTVLHKAAAAKSNLALDGDFGEEQITVQDPSGFAVGCGVAVWDDRAGGFHTTVARITGQNGSTLSIDKPLMADCMVANGGQVATVFPVVSGYNLEGARVEDLVIEGNRSENYPLNGCRGAGIFLYRGFGTVIQNCEVRDYNGDGISFQQSNDVSVLNCVSKDNSQLGLHPGSGSQRPIVRGCTATNNGTDGLFLCWRVRHGLFEENTLMKNGRYGISIGHKDSDNRLRRNQIRDNSSNGVFFRNETVGMAAHRNRLEENTIENNGTKSGTAGIRIRGQTNGLEFVRNTIRDTRDPAKRTQTVGIRIDEQAGPIVIEDNNIDAAVPVNDRRSKGE